MIRRRRRRLSPLPLAVLAAALLGPLAGAAVPAGASAEQAEVGEVGDGLTLWYDEPATSWESQTLPIGSGALGASVFGSVATERLQFNEKTLWTGGPGSVQGYDYGNWRSPRPGAVEEVQDRIDAEERVGAGWVAGRLGQPRRGYGSYQTFGELRITQTAPPAEVSGYRRELDIAEAVAGMSYTGDGVRHTREYFASAAHEVIVARLAADRPGAVDVTIAHTAPANRSRQAGAAEGRITVAGRLNDNAMRYEAQLQVLNEGGTRTDNADGTVTVADADAVVVVLGAGTDYADSYPAYRGADPHESVTARVDAAAATPYAQLRAAHVQDHAELFDRVALDLGQQPPDVPTDELLARYRTGGAAPAERRALEVLFFQYGRYLLIASSRAGSLPANLQGVWNDSTAAPWGADYHVNINLQMNYWPAHVTNLAETAAPLFDFVDALAVPGRVTAEQLFGNRGWVVMNETTPFGFTGVHDWATAFWFPEAAAWLAQQYYDHYRFTLDREFLAERAYPVMKELARFWLDELRADPRDGTLVVTPSYSPEHGDFTAGASMSQQIVWDLLTNVTEAAAVLGDDDTEFVEAAAQALERLDPGTRIGSWGQLQEWKGDWDDPGDTHRHVSHLFGLHPGRQISPLTTLQLADAAEVSLTARGDGGTGWSKAWKVNFWARLLDGDHAHRMLAEQLKHSTLANLWDTHPPFQIDGNLGATAGVAEMLLQSHTGTIDVLPALPGAWAEGSVRGLRARGDVTVDVEWSGGTATEIALTTGRDGPLAVRSSLFAGRFQVVDDATGRAVEVVRDGDTVTIDARAGHTYRVVTHAVVTVSAPERIGWSQTVPVEVTVTAPTRRPVPSGLLTLQLPDGWSAEPRELRIRPVSGRTSQTFTVDVTAGAGPGEAAVAAELAGDGWTVRGTTTATTFDPSIIDQSRIRVVEADSEETAGEDGRAANVIDGSSATYWHTRWSAGSDPLPHHIVLDLGERHELTALRYLPRQDSANGRIAGYEVYVSDDATNWGAPVSTGTFPAGAAEHRVDLAGASGRYVTLAATSSHTGPWTTVAELNVHRALD